MDNILKFIKPFIMSDSDVSNSFTVVIILVGFIGFCFRMLKRRNNFVLIFPSIAISLGILGTFTGIYIGLIGFDVSNISASVPQLLEGLKTAFTTSILGMSVSIVLRIVYEIKDIFEDDKREIDDPVPLLQEITKGIENLGVSSKEIERAIVACFRSEEEYSLLSQLKLMRQEITDTRRETIKSFENFAEKFSEMGTKALVKALENVINDFNVLLNELVSDSFKELSQAMIKLVDWQDNYRVHIDQMQEKTAALMAQMEASVNILNQSAEKLISIDNNLSNISISVGKISVSAEDIENHVELLKNQNAMLKEGIEGIRQIGQEAKTAIPTLTQHLKEITDNLSETVSNTSKKLEESNNAIGNFVDASTKEIQKAAAGYAEKVQESMNKIDDNLERMITGTSDSLTKHLEKITDNLSETVSNTSKKLEDANNAIGNFVDTSTKEIQNAATGYAKKVQESMNKIDENLKQEVAEVMKSLGGILTTLSENFISNLTQHLKEITDNLSETVLNTSQKLEESNKMIQWTVENTANVINVAVKNLTEDVKNAVKDIDDGLEQELTKSLNSLAGRLIAVSEKFATDYTPLAERLREVVRLSEKIEKDRIGELTNVK